jgi:antitoxin (DNA-binding transcriptional repressor) of toxin-antitoxin stability system
MNIEIGSYEAKTKLPELLRGVQLGNRYTITLRGLVVAELIPPDISKQHAAAEAVADMQRFISSHDAMEGIDTKALIEDGRD